VSMDELEQQYRHFAVELSAPTTGGDRWTLFRSTAYEPRAAGPVKAPVPLTDAQVHLVFLQLRGWRPPYRDAANAELVSAQVAAPQNREVLYWRALFALEHGAPAEAERLLRAVLESEDSAEPSPLEGHYRLALLLSRVAQVLKEGAKPAAELLAPLEDDVTALARVASSATELNGVAHYRLLVRQPEAGMPFAMRAVQADPTCFECFDTLANLHAQRGRFAQAAQAEERAYSLMPESVHAPRIAILLAQFRQKAAEAKANPDATPAATNAATTTP
jgi:hypothetical protein